jgi:hypothetical protein
LPYPAHLPGQAGSSGSFHLPYLEDGFLNLLQEIGALRFRTGHHRLLAAYGPEGSEDSVKSLTIRVFPTAQLGFYLYPGPLTPFKLRLEILLLLRLRCEASSELG